MSLAPRAVIEYERGVREGSAGVHEAPRERFGLAVPVDVGALVDSVYVSPIAPGWVHELVTAIVVRYAFDWPVLRSPLADQPVY